MPQKRSSTMTYTISKQMASGIALLVASLYGTSNTAAAEINWSVLLGNPDQSGTVGTSLVYNGTITNSTGADLFLSTANLTFDTTAPASSYTKGLSDEFLATLGIIPTSGYSGPLFSVTWQTGVSAGMTGLGTFSLTAEDPAFPSIVTSPFSSSASPTEGSEISSDTWYHFQFGDVGSFATGSFA